MEELKYKLTSEQKKYFSSVLIMDIIINDNVIFPVTLSDKEANLEPFLIYMLEKDFLDVTRDGYKPTKKGRDMLTNHKEKLTEFRAIYKIYSAVDLGKGEFAYSRYFDFDTDDEFIKFINEPQFEDMRVAVCEFKNINPLEVIFLEMIDSGMFPLEGEKWVDELINSPNWEKIVSIANDNIHVEQLEEKDDNGNVTATGEDVMKLILKEGAKVSTELLKRQQEIDGAAQGENNTEEETLEETTTTTTEVEYVDCPYYDYSYYNIYYDPYYVSPCWGMYWY